MLNVRLSDLFYSLILQEVEPTEYALTTKKILLIAHEYNKAQQKKPSPNAKK